MRKLFAGVLLVLLIGACGGKDEPRTPSPTPTVDGVKAYYGSGDTAEAEEGSIEDIETEYHQPPKPAEAGLGETITLTGSNIGVRLDVTVTDVKRVDDYLAVDLELESTGITNHEAAFENAAVTFADGQPRKAIIDATASCSGDITVPTTFIPVGGKASGCLLFPPEGSEPPDRFQLALEAVPVEAGGIWNLG